MPHPPLSFFISATSVTWQRHAACKGADRDVFFADELATLAGPTLETTYIYTRKAPADWRGRIGRLTREAVEAHTIPASLRPRVFICGPTSFVDATAVWLQDLGHAAEDIRTERFGGT